MSTEVLRRSLLAAFGAFAIATVATIGWAMADSDSADEGDGVPRADATPGAPTESPRPEPAIGDHWHAVIAIFIGDERQANIPTFTGPEEIHTHGDGIIHMHPFIPAGEGPGAAIGKFFKYGGGKLTSSELHIPGQRETYKNGDLVPGTQTPGFVRILKADSGIHPLGSGFAKAIEACDALSESDFTEATPNYVPRDGDCIRIVFGPE